MATQPKPELSTREKLAMNLLLWGVTILAPWEYSHQQDAFIKEIKELLK